MVRALGVLIAVAYLAILAVLLFWMLNVTGLALCSGDPRALTLSDDCIDGTSTERAVGLVLGWGAVLAAVATIVLALLASRGHPTGVRIALAALATPLLAVGGILLLPVSF